uniref:Uncharacterized protein n=1 Tax=Arundo donax TaxID=35708 RepID=A0A0A9GS62_ARUDO
MKATCSTCREIFWFSTELFLFSVYVCQSLVPDVLFSTLHIFYVA